MVTTTTPADGATGVGLGANVVVNFSETVAGLNQSSVELRNTATGTLVPRALTVNAAGTRVTINPDANLARNTVYECPTGRRPGSHPGRLRQPAGHHHLHLPHQTLRRINP